MSITCSILVPVYNEAWHIGPSIEAMQRQQLDGELEIIVADGGSTDGTLAVLRSLAAADRRIRILFNPERTVTSGLNLALEHAHGTYVARMDAHTLYPEGYVARGIARLQQGGTRWVSGPQIPRGSGLVSRTVTIALGSALGRGASRKWDSGRQGEFELDTGVFAGVWERSTLLEYGGWDERWEVNEDSELAARFLERGERLICLPELGAIYTPRDTLGGLWRQYRAYGRYRERTAVAHPISMRRSHLLAPGVALALVGALAPGPLGSMARLGVAAWMLMLLSAGVRAGRQGQARAESALLPLVLATLQLGHGVGFLEGVGRYGLPVEAIRAALTP